MFSPHCCGSMADGIVLILMRKCRSEIPYSPLLLSIGGRFCYVPSFHSTNLTEKCA
jgi:hypothetical protein